MVATVIIRTLCLFQVGIRASSNTTRAFHNHQAIHWVDIPVLVGNIYLGGNIPILYLALGTNLINQHLDATRLIQRLMHLLGGGSPWIILL